MASATDGCKWVIYQGSRGPALLSKHSLGCQAGAQPAVTGSIEEMSQLWHIQYEALSTSATSKAILFSSLEPPCDKLKNYCTSGSGEM